MNFRAFKNGVNVTFQVGVGAIALSLLLASCVGGTNSGDIIANADPAAPVPVAGPDSFLLYPNPQSNPAVDSQAYAQAYYTAIDPNNDKDTLAKWKAINGFGSSTGTEVQAVFGDMRDLGYGRYVTARKNTDGTIAFYVDNYLVWTAAGYGYSSMNLDAAVARDQRWYIGTNAIEFSPGPNGGAPFAKYFTFEPSAGARLLAANLDGRGAKGMPGICIVCHGGRGDPLTPPDASGNQLFALVGNPASAVRGDVKGKLHFFEPDTFSYSTLSGYTRADLEANIKTLNKWVLCTYPLASGVSNTTYPEDTCRNQAPLNEWQGGAAAVVKAAYGGDGLPNATYADSYVPASWVSAGQTNLYQNVVQPTCRMCHILRGTGQASDDDFTDFVSFQSSADRIKAHIIDRGNMPLTKVLYNRYWATPSMYNTLNQFLQAPDPINNPTIGYNVLDSSGQPLRPGRPIADAGLSRVIGTTSTTLNAGNSLYADTYTWSIVSNPGSAATLSSNTSAQTTFNATADGTYSVQLVANKGVVQSDPAQITIVVKASTWTTNITPPGALSAVSNPLPASIRFSDIKAVLQLTGGKTCISCHVPSPAAGVLAGGAPPIIYTDIDRNLDGVVASGVGETDDKWFYTEVVGRINFADLAASPLLRRPAGYDHPGGIQPGFGIGASGIHADDPQLAPGDSNRAFFDMFVNWVLNGAPY